MGNKPNKPVEVEPSEPESVVDPDDVSVGRAFVCGVYTHRFPKSSNDIRSLIVPVFSSLLLFSHDRLWYVLTKYNLSSRNE